MSSQEIQLTITPEQAAHGVILPVSLPGGTTRLRIPSGCRDGQLLSVRAGGAEVAVRLRIAPAAPTPAPPPTVAAPAVPGQRPARSGGTAGCLAVLAAIATVIIAAVALNSGDDGKGAASSSPTPTYGSWSPTPLPSGTSYTSGTSTGSSTGSGSGSGSVPYPSTAPTAAAPAPSPFDAGTCLNGQLPDSTTAQRVEDVNEVSCSASDAHYKVIQRFGFTSDLHSCDANPRTEYAFSYRYTLNGTPINQYVYCLVGLGSYARS
ncbi:LppU/SCO3897 family protein [Streptomyces vinaceus]|uniref:LppU/SCO3897 family protein n=1 Tax=Streptomyces vinaceus TaxID=1960 RepID=UPI0036C2DD2A